MAMRQRSINHCARSRLVPINTVGKHVRRTISGSPVRDGRKEPTVSTVGSERKNVEAPKGRKKASGGQNGFFRP